MQRAIGIGAVLALSACVDASSSIATELTRYGLDAERAQCVGQRIERDLSVSQLQELARAARAYGTGDSNPGQLTLGDLTRVAGQIRDPAVPLAVARAGGGCGVSIGEVLR